MLKDSGTNYSESLLFGRSLLSLSLIFAFWLTDWTRRPGVPGRWGCVDLSVGPNVKGGWVPDVQQIIGKDHPVCVGRTTEGERSQIRKEKIGSLSFADSINGIIILLPLEGVRPFSPLVLQGAIGETFGSLRHEDMQEGDLGVFVFVTVSLSCGKPRIFLP